MRDCFRRELHLQNRRSLKSLIRKGENICIWEQMLFLIPQTQDRATSSDLREAARWVCRPEEILGAIGLINHLGKAFFIQGLSNEHIQTIVQSRGESILLSQAIEVSLEEESAILSAKERSPSAANGPPLRCNRCNKLGHTTSRCMRTDKFPLPV